MNKKILVVDDNTKYCDSVVDVLEIEGYDVTGVYDGFKALEAIGKGSYDLVLVDIKMPMMDGIDTFKKIREISPKIPTIMMTAFAFEDSIREGLRTGAFGAFRKPINYEKLFCSIERAFPDGALVMIASNDKEPCSGLFDVLVEKGYRVLVARDGDTAIQMAMEERFDIIILDTQLPDINDTKVYPTIRDIRPEVPVISITDNKEETEDTVAQSFEKGVYTYLEKPLNTDHLLEVIQKAIGK